MRFGAIERLHVIGGAAEFEPAPRLVQEIKLDAEFADASCGRSTDVEASDARLFQFIASMSDGVIDRVEIRHGLPFRVIRTLSEGAA